MKIDSVAMYVADLAKAKDFFVDQLGGKANAEDPDPRTHFRFYFISFEDGARVEIVTRPEICNEDKPLFQGRLCSHCVSRWQQREGR